MKFCPTCCRSSSLCRSSGSTCESMLGCFLNQVPSLDSNPCLMNEQVSTNTGPRSVAIYRNQFSHQQYPWLCSSVSRVMASGASGSYPTSGKFFKMIFHLYEEMNQMVKNNKNSNSSYSLVFGRWPQTTRTNQKHKNKPNFISQSPNKGQRSIEP